MVSYLQPNNGQGRREHMKSAPVVPPALEASLVQLSAYLGRTAYIGRKFHMNVVSEVDQLHVHVFVESGRIVSWEIRDYAYTVGYMAAKLDEIWSRSSRVARHPVCLYAWDGELVRHKLGREIGPATDPYVTPPAESPNTDSNAPAH
jgi:hypothetical protein